jgi:hypothetical protein
MKAENLLIYASLLIFVLTLAACGSQNVAVPVPQAINLALVPPPVARYEQPIKSNDPQNGIWRPGYWYYEHGFYSWESGYLMPRPLRTAVWSADHWEQRSYGWPFIPGFWQ